MRWKGSGFIEALEPGAIASPIIRESIVAGSWSLIRVRYRHGENIFLPCSQCYEKIFRIFGKYFAMPLMLYNKMFAQC